MASKTYSKGAKRRAKKAMPELASAPRRKARGRQRMAEIKADPEAERTVLEARARQSGLGLDELLEWLETKSTRSAKAVKLKQSGFSFAEVGEELGVSGNRAEQIVEAAHVMMETEKVSILRNPALGEAAGRAIHAIHGGEAAKRLWSAYTAFTASEATYAKHYLGLRLHANTAKLEMMVERIETRADDKPDLRTEEERSRDASNNWMRWRGMIMHLANPDQRVIFDVAYGRAEPMDAGKITTTGAYFVAAIERLADVVDRHSGTR